MSGDPVHAVSRLRSRLDEVRDTAVRLKAIRDRLRQESERNSVEVERLEARLERQTKIGELFRVLMDKMIHDQVKVIEDVVTEGLQVIFGTELSFEVELTTKRNKVWIDFFIRSGDKSDPMSHRGRPLESFGGGPSSVVSLILRLLTMMRLKNFPLLVLDETLGAVSEYHVEKTGQFLRSLVEKSGYSVFFVTHVMGYLDHADRAYNCTLEDTHLCVVEQ